MKKTSFNFAKYQGIWRVFHSEPRVKTRKVSYKVQGATRSIESLVYILQEAKSIIDHLDTSCIMIDSTFKAMKPYVIAIPIAILRNSYMPLGISIALTEDARIYGIFLIYMKNTLIVRIKTRFPNRRWICD
jgi:hypothetical protein